MPHYDETHTHITLVDLKPLDIVSYTFWNSKQNKNIQTRKRIVDIFITRENQRKLLKVEICNKK